MSRTDEETCGDAREKARKANVQEVMEGKHWLYAEDNGGERITEKR